MTRPTITRPSRPAGHHDRMTSEHQVKHTATKKPPTSTSSTATAPDAPAGQDVTRPEDTPAANAGYRTGVQHLRRLRQGKDGHGR